VARSRRPEGGAVLAEEQRLTGEHWWDPDRRQHVDDLPRHCPRCAAELDVGTGISVEYWEADRRVYHTWCGACRWTGDIVPVDRMIGHEASE
jgi:hypothetical protein